MRTNANRLIGRIVTDLLLTLLALYAATWARYLIPWGVDVPWKVVVLPWPIYVIAALIWPFSLGLVSSYAPSQHGGRRLGAEIHVLLRGVFVGILLLAGILYFSYRLVPRRLVFYFGCIDSVLLSVARVIQTSLRLVHLRNGNAPRLLIAGAGRIGTEIARQVQGRNSNWHLVGFLDDDPRKLGEEIAEAPVLGSLDDIEEIIRTEKVDEVVFALPLRAHERLMQLVLDMEKLPVEVSVIPDYFDLAFYRTRMDEMFGFPLIRLRASAIEGQVRLIKRMFDLVLGTFLLVMCAPVFPLIALAIRLDSPGPAFFKQERVGENCKTFGMWKFRTMVEDADQRLSEVITEAPDGSVIHKRPDDPRVTRVGHFLRRYSLDELPQLINVVKGEMSLVGPRPELPRLVDQYEGWQRKRFAVPPGMTGWWQVSGRSNRMMHLHVEDDLYYIQNYSIWLDLRILWRTIGVVLSGTGAY